MFLKKRLFDIRHTLAFRLTLWYAGIFMFSACVAFLFFYLLITSVIRQQTDQDLLIGARTFSSILSSHGPEALKQQAFLEAQASGEKKVFFRLLYITGQLFSSSNMSYWRDIGINKDSIKRLPTDRQPAFDTISIPGRKHKVRILYAILGPGLIVQLGRSMDAHTRIIEAFRKIFVVTMAVLFVLAVIVGWFMAKRALAGVDTVIHTARRISERSLDERVPVKKQVDEIDQLAITFNQMLDRIQKLVTEIKEMNDNIAHDLKSPITRIRGIAEVSLTTESTLQDYENMAGNTIEECDRLLNMINTMLIISKTEAGLGQFEKKELDIAKVVQDACELFLPMAEIEGLTLVCDTLDRLITNGDIRMVQRMISNLIDNAVKYTPAGGKIEVTALSDGRQSIRISIKDSGRGISEKDLPHIFERFYRCDPSRSQTGTGLGLSFARAVARAHGGEITVTSVPNEGSTFTVTLPNTLAA
ncbi:MAG: HAMP domain-containing protein [Deltaproteobacteria bacterium]|nr:HAMP domain-containing protein [Deltaproteobacteria bacterium]